MYLTLVFLFSSIEFVFVTRIIRERSLEIEHQLCPMNYHYLSDSSTCILFATSQQGDLTWDESIQACQANSAEIFNITDSKDLRIFERKLQEKSTYKEHFQTGAWIGNASK